MTNITPQHKELFEAIRNPHYGNFALLSVVYDGEPAAAVVVVNEESQIVGSDSVQVTPVAVFLTDGMCDKLVAHVGSDSVQVTRRDTTERGDGNE